MLRSKTIRAMSSGSIVSWLVGATSTAYSCCPCVCAGPRAFSDGTDGAPCRIRVNLRALPTLARCVLSANSLPAADLIADAVMLRFTRKHFAFVRHRNPAQQKFWDFLALCGAGAEGAGADNAMHYDWGKIIHQIEVMRRIRLDTCLLQSHKHHASLP